MPDVFALTVLCGINGMLFNQMVLVLRRLIIGWHERMMAEAAAHEARWPDPWGLLSIALVLGGWQLVAWSYDTVLFPGPWQTAVAIVQNFPTIVGEIGNTLRRAFTAFGLSVLVMVPFGIACGRLRPLGLIVDPILEFLVTIPPPAIIPIVMILAGIGDVAKIAVISYAMIPSILINTIETVRQAPPMLDRVGRSLRLSRLESMALIDLPAAMPGIVTGLRLAVIGVAAGDHHVRDAALDQRHRRLRAAQPGELSRVVGPRRHRCHRASWACSSISACASSRSACCSGTIAAASRRSDGGIAHDLAARWVRRVLRRVGRRSSRYVRLYPPPRPRPDRLSRVYGSLSPYAPRYRGSSYASGSSASDTVNGGNFRHRSGLPPTSKVSAFPYLESP